MNSFYRSIQNLIPLSSNQELLLERSANAIRLNIRLILQSRGEPDCGLGYDDNSVENIIWMVSLMSTSWIITNLKSKIIDGHCHNTNHEHGVQEPRLCPIGSRFHKEFYAEVIKSLEDLMKIAANSE
jgi:hypothetical protein